jgi:LuxR family transcriptional regulator, maltose regulon positive regulatory protein
MPSELLTIDVLQKNSLAIPEVDYLAEQDNDSVCESSELLLRDWLASDRTAAIPLLAALLPMWNNAGDTERVLHYTTRLSRQELLAEQALLVGHCVALLANRRYNEAAELLLAAARSPAAAQSLANTAEPLTEREIAVLQLLARGFTNKEISLRSRIALSTTKWHLKNVFAKLNVATRTAALARARELHLLQ